MASPSLEAARASSPGPWGSSGLRNFAFRVAYSFLVQDGCGRCGIVYDDADEDGFLRRDGLKGQDVHAAIGEIAWQTFPSEPGRLSMRMVNSSLMGIGDLLEIDDRNARVRTKNPMPQRFNVVSAGILRPGPWLCKGSSRVGRRPETRCGKRNWVYTPAHRKASGHSDEEFLPREYEHSLEPGSSLGPGVSAGSQLVRV